MRKEILWLEADPRSPEQGQYGFLQDLVRHVAYETLSRRDRHVRHVAAAQYLASALAEDEVAEVIASHLVEAYRTASDDDAPELRGRAREALVRAAERAQGLGAMTEAQRYVERAVELAPEPAAEAFLLHWAGSLAWRANRPVEARGLLERAHTAFVKIDDTAAAARSSLILGEIDFSEGHAAAAVERLSDAVATLSARESDADYAAAVAQLARFLGLSGDHDRADRYVDEALALAEALDLPEVLASGLNTRANLLLRRDRPQEAKVLLEGALRIAREHELHTVGLRSTNNLLVTLDTLDRVAEQLPIMIDAIELARRAGDRSWDILLKAGLAAGLANLGRWNEALAVYAELGDNASTALQQISVLDIVPLHCERGDVGLARALFSSLSLLEDSDDSQVVIVRALAEVNLLRAEGDLEAAQRAADHALTLRDELGVTFSAVKLAAAEVLETALARRDEARVEEVLALIDALRPGERTPLWRAIRARYGARLAALRDEDADAGFRSATALYDDLGFVFPAAATRLEHAEWLITQRRTEEAASLLAEAGATFEELGAQPWLERLGQTTALARTGVEATA